MAMTSPVSLKSASGWSIQHLIHLQHGARQRIQLINTFDDIFGSHGALMAVLVLAGVPFDKWLRFAAPLCAVLYVFALLAILVAVALGLR